MGGGPPSFPQDSSCPVVLRTMHVPFPIPHTGLSPCTAGLPSSVLLWYAATFRDRGPGAFHTPPCPHGGLGSFPFARRYSGNRFFFPFLRLLRCFSSPGSPRTAIKGLRPSFTVRCTGVSRAGFPIQTSTDRGIFAPPRGFSQLVTSFIGSQCPGIRPVPFSA